MGVFIRSLLRFVDLHESICIQSTLELLSDIDLRDVSYRWPNHAKVLMPVSLRELDVIESALDLFGDLMRARPENISAVFAESPPH